MATDNSLLIQQLRQAIVLLSTPKKEEGLTQDDLKVFSIAESIFGDNYHFKDYNSFLKKLPISAVDDYIHELQKPEEEDEPKKEVDSENQDASVPPELEALVAEYQQNQALLEKEDVKSSFKKTVAEQIKIAVEHAKIKKLALYNRQQREKNGEKFKNLDDLIVKLGSPKSESLADALANSYNATKQVAFTYDKFGDLPAEIQNQIISSAVELNTVGVSDIDTAIQSSAFKIDASVLDESSRNSLSAIPGGFVSTIYQEIASQNEKTLENEAKIIANQEIIYDSQKDGKSEKFEEFQQLIEENQQLKALNESQSAELSSLVEKQTEAVKQNEAKITINQEKISVFQKEEEEVQQLVKENQQLKELSKTQSVELTDLVAKQTEVVKGNEAKITANQEKISDFQKDGKLEKVAQLIEENQQLKKLNESQSVELSNLIEKQTESFKEFEKSRQIRLSRDPDLIDLIESANKKVASIQNNLQNNGITPHIYTPMDDAHLLEEAIRAGLPGNLLPQSGYQAEYAASLINNPKTQHTHLSPAAILLYGKGLTPELLTKARIFAKQNVNSKLGQLFQYRPDIFHSAATQITKISESPLGKEIGVATKGLGKIFNNVTKYVGKFTDKIPGGLGNVVHIIQNPWGALRSWAGKQAGEFILKKIVSRISNEALKNIAETLLKNGLKETVKNLVQQAATKAATNLALKFAAKAGTKLALQSGAQAANVIPGLGILIAVVIEVAFWVIGKVTAFIKNISRSLYGEDVKAQDLVAASTLASGGFISGVVTFVAALGAATVAAAGSATTIIVVSSLLSVFFYMTSIAVAPLISTLVQLESTTRKVATNGCASWPTDGVYMVTQGPLGTYSHLEFGSQAIDIGASKGDNIAAAPGTVTEVYYLYGSYGNTVVVEAETSIGTIRMRYAHMTGINVSQGDYVNVGDSIGGVGGTGGWRTHIHFEYHDGVEYNSCPAGDVPVPLYCSMNCQYNGQPIYSNQTTP